MFEDKELAEKQAAAVEKQIHGEGDIAVGGIDHEKNVATLTERAV